MSAERPTLEQCRETIARLQSAFENKNAKKPDLLALWEATAFTSWDQKITHEEMRLRIRLGR